MKVILLEDVVGAGRAGDVVEVANGYARNKLFPSGIAIEANKTNMKTLEHRRAKIAAKKAADKDMAQEFAVVLEGKQVDFVAKAGDAGRLFGSVTAHDIAEAVNEKLGFEIDRRKLLLDAPLKETGIHDVKYRIYPEVEAVIKVNILAEGAPALPPAEKLRDTYADEDLEDERNEEDVESAGNYVYDARDEEASGIADIAGAEETAEDADEAGAEKTAEDADEAEEAEPDAETGPEAEEDD